MNTSTIIADNLKYNVKDGKYRSLSYLLIHVIESNSIDEFLEYLKDNDLINLRSSYDNTNILQELFRMTDNIYTCYSRYENIPTKFKPITKLSEFEFRKRFFEPIKSIYKYTEHMYVLKSEILIKFMEFLVENGLDVDNISSHKYTVLDMSVMVQNYDICKYLIDNGANLSSNYKRYEEFILNDEKVHNLLKLLFELDLEKDTTPIANTSFEMYVELLGTNCYVPNIIANIKNTNSFEAKNRYGYTLLHMALNPKNMNITRKNVDFEKAARLLIDNGANLNKQNNFGRSPLATALTADCFSNELIKYMIEKGAKLNTEFDKLDYKTAYDRISTDFNIITNYRVEKDSLQFKQLAELSKYLKENFEKFNNYTATTPKRKN